MRLYGHNKTTINIAENAIFYERTKYIEADSHIVCKKLKKKINVAKHISSGH